MSLAEAATHTLKLIEHSLRRNSICDRVNAKDLMAIFLMRAKRGYFLDTNFFPHKVDT